MNSLADVPDLSGLAALARDPRLDLKPVVLRVQTDLFVAAPVRDAATIREFESLALGLIPTVDALTAGIVARKLAPRPDTPERVLCALARLGGEPRTAVVTLCPQLSEPVLAAALAAGGDLGSAIAVRRDLGEETVRGLADSGDPRVDLALALNDALPLRGATLRALTARARARPALAGILLARSDLADVDLAPLYLEADGERRTAIRAAVAALAALWPPERRDGGAGAVLTALSGRGDVEGFIRALAAAVGLDDPAGLDVLAPARRDLLAFALRAAGLTHEEAVFVFLTLDPEIARSVPAVNGLARLFRETDAPTARALVAAILDLPDCGGCAGLREGERHVPLLAPEGVTSRAGRSASGKPASGKSTSGKSVAGKSVAGKTAAPKASAVGATGTKSAAPEPRARPTGSGSRHR